jgi:hypothetical protein
MWDSAVSDCLSWRISTSNVSIPRLLSKHRTYFGRIVSRRAEKRKAERKSGFDRCSDKYLDAGSRKDGFGALQPDAGNPFSG